MGVNHVKSSIKAVKKTLRRVVGSEARRQCVHRKDQLAQAPISALHLSAGPVSVKQPTTKSLDYISGGILSFY